MLAFLLQSGAWMDFGRVYLFALFMLMIWLLWIIRVVLSLEYRPFDEPYSVSTSVVIPVVDESPTLFHAVLSTITEQHPDEIIVVINGPPNPVLERICQSFGVRWTWLAQAGKRRAVCLGVRMATSDIVVLVDSDTLWTDGTLSELVRPFRDPDVGGVTSRQRILWPDRNVLTQWADWLENIRNDYTMPAMSVLGTVGCLPGRTIAFRRCILLTCMNRFLSERFLGVFLEVSDDRTLTNYTLQAG
ncbi:glycosyltransferase [Aeromicrobium sp.]|uniref:glycosyltransferase n=1 Tax=Aeromicrobium sp. TaxID=1871063 RepID=UPI003D6AAF21